VASKKRVVVSWSSGKDSAWALHVLRRREDIEVVGLITTVNQAFDRVAMHSTRAEILEAQARAAGLPLIKVLLPWPCSNQAYEERMTDCVATLHTEGVQAVAFGDLFLEDIRAYREKQMQHAGLEPMFPLWQLPTDVLAREMIAAGLKAKLVCVDPRKLDAAFTGREFDERLLAELPATVDPCGENGEFHTCVYAGSMLNTAVGLGCGEIVERDGFIFCDVVLTESGFIARNEQV
jgi:uncharacterized protein (TIGR00290 family)